MRRAIVGCVVAVTFVVVGCTSSDPTASDEYAAIEQDLIEAQALISDAESDLPATTAEREALAAQIAASETVIAQVEANEKAHFEAIMSKDLEAMMATYTDDAVFVDETFGDWVEGTEALTRFNDVVLTMIDPEATKIIESYVSADGSRATSVRSWIGTSYYGYPFDLPMVLIHEYRERVVYRNLIAETQTNPLKQAA
jgi:ketosteroid isomerase-like protein